MGVRHKCPLRSLEATLRPQAARRLAPRVWTLVGFEMRDEILVSELVRRSIVFCVPLYVRGVHVADVPLIYLIPSIVGIDNRAEPDIDSSLGRLLGPVCHLLMTARLTKQVCHSGMVRADCPDKRRPPVECPRTLGPRVRAAFGWRSRRIDAQ